MVMAKSYRAADLAQPLAHYPHARRAGDFVFVSGVSSRRPDNTHRGVTIDDDGRVELDITQQTQAVLDNVDRILGEAGSSLDDIVDVSVFLVDMDDYDAFNAVYNRHFSASDGPARTAVGVDQLPHPHLLVELKVVAHVPADASDTGLEA